MFEVPLSTCSDPEQVRFEAENSRIFLRQWRGVRVNGEVPRADAIDPASMKTLLPEIIIYELPNANTVRYRLAGTLAVERLGFEPRGMNLVEFARPDMRPLVALAFGLVAHSRIGVLTHFKLVHGGARPARMEMLLLPLQAPEGKPPRVISLISREPLPPGQARTGIEQPTEAIDDATLFDIGFGLPDLPMIPGLKLT